MFRNLVLWWFFIMVWGRCLMFDFGLVIEEQILDLSHPQRRDTNQISAPLVA